jgi:hypothetical protein
VKKFAIKLIDEILCRKAAQSVKSGQFVSSADWGGWDQRIKEKWPKGQAGRHCSDFPRFAYPTKAQCRFCDLNHFRVLLYGNYCPGALPKVPIL